MKGADLLEEGGPQCRTSDGLIVQAVEDFRQQRDRFAQAVVQAHADFATL
ncbi:hypothetical protein ACFFS2_41185 [Streptomyces aurantiacus]|uniref:Uncharacterized protein n=1 Tax=Streptomyces aurantiacus TaxID=47760 RepID=A0A7G1NZ30_9ACTN|nr:hypothetical protein [Streptomyces aurantiacus]BCL26827.1 hypothetical protein GCM10017557_16860 [Streptomyces aurantiacus]